MTFKTNNRAFRRSKTVSNIPIGCIIASDTNKLTEFVDFVEKLWIYTKTRKMLTLSEAMRHPMRILDTVLERPKVLLLVLESPGIVPGIYVLLGQQ